MVHERIWHPSQEIRDQPDGAVVFSMEVAINYEVLSWILGFGSKAEVLEPPELRDRINQELGRAMARYSENIRTLDESGV